MEPVVSVIVPVFDVVDYLDEGLQTIVEQDFKDGYQVVLVDDCSTDGSLEICRKYNRNYDYFELIEFKENQGVSAARNAGLDAAIGKYILFFDPDDRLSKKALSQLVSTANQYKVDIVKANMVLFDENGYRDAPDKVSSLRLFTGGDVLKALYDHKYIRGHPHGKLLLREKFNSIRFTQNVRMAQDLLYFSQVFSCADSLIIMPEIVHEYRKRKTGSTGRKYAKGSWLDWLNAVEKTGKFAVSSHMHQKAHKRLMVRTLAQISREIRNIPGHDAKKVLTIIEDKQRQWNINFKSLLFDNYLGLRSILHYIKTKKALNQVKRKIA